MADTDLLRLGAVFVAALDEYTAAHTQLLALQHENDRDAAEAGFVYGSAAWYTHRFAATGPTVHRVNALYARLEDLGEEISRLAAETVEGLLIKARVYQFTGNSAAIIMDIETLTKAGKQEAA